MAVVAVARVKAKDGTGPALGAELRSMRGLAVEEEGCIQFAVVQGQADPSLFMSYEEWATQDDLDRHLQMPYMKAFMEKAAEMLAGAPEISLWREISMT